jgi:hypothetical protein
LSIFSFSKSFFIFVNEISFSKGKIYFEKKFDNDYLN